MPLDATKEILVLERWFKDANVVIILCSYHHDMMVRPSVYKLTLQFILNRERGRNTPVDQLKGWDRQPFHLWIIEGG